MSELGIIQTLPNQSIVQWYLLNVSNFSLCNVPEENFILFYITLYSTFI